MMYSTDTDSFTICGIDPGTIFLGLSIMKVSTTDLSILESSAYTISALGVYRGTYYTTVNQDKLTSIDRINLITKSTLSRLSNVENLSALTIEEPFFNRRRPGAFGPLVLQTDHIKRSIKAQHPNIGIFGYSPISIKSGVGVKKMKGKEPVFEAVLSNKEIMSTLTCRADLMTEHAIDSLACAYTHVVKMRRTFS